VRDVCRATTAAPTFFSPVKFTVSADVTPMVPDPDPELKPDTDEETDTYEETDTDEETDADVEADPNEDPLNRGDDTKATFNMIDGGIAANNPVGFSSVDPVRNTYMHQLSQSGISSFVLSFISV